MSRVKKKNFNLSYVKNPSKNKQNSLQTKNSSKIQSLTDYKPTTFPKKVNQIKGQFQIR